MFLMVANVVLAQSSELKYTASFAFVKCADINIKISENQNITKVSATGKSCGLANFVVKLDEKYDCYIDKNNDYLPTRIEKISTNSDSAININLDFNQSENIVTNSILGTYNVLPKPYDFLSALLLISKKDFFAQTSERKINLFFDNSPCILSIKLCGDKTVNNISCKKLELKITKLSPDNQSRKFLSLIPSNSEHYICISNSEPHIVVSAKINLAVGNLKIDLE